MKGENGIVAAFERLVALWRTLGHPIVDRLRPGLSREEILAVAQSYGITPCEDALVWYGCCNGSDPYTFPQENGRFFDRFWIPDLETALKSSALMVELEGEEWEGIWLLKEDAYAYMVRSQPESDGTFPLWYQPEDLDAVVQFASAEAFLKTLHDWYAEGALQLVFLEDETGGSFVEVDEVDAAKYREIGARHNPGIPHWK